MIAGAVFTVLTTMTNMIVLYRFIENLANESAEAYGFALHAGFAVVISLKVLLYGLWSGIAYREKCEREARAAGKKPSRRSKK